MLLSETQSTAFFALVPWIVFFPLVGLLVNLVLGKRLGELVIAIVASLASGSAFVVSVLLAIAIYGADQAEIVPFADCINIGELQIRWAFPVATLSVTMMLVVWGVGTRLHIYSAVYMRSCRRYKGDPKSYQRFFIYLHRFIAFMMGL